jgi:hypothetical protein
MPPELTPDELDAIWRSMEEGPDPAPVAPTPAPSVAAAPAPPVMTMVEGRAAFEAGVWNDGIVCPCCDRWGKGYKRKLNAGMARALIVFYRITVQLTPEDGWINVTVHDLPGLPRLSDALRLNLQHWEYTKLSFWGLIEARPNQDPNRDRDGSGIWRLTSLGVDFVRSRVSVPRHVFVLDNTARGFSDERIEIGAAWGDGFNFDELMADSSHPTERRRGQGTSPAAPVPPDLSCLD